MKLRGVHVLKTETVTIGLGDCLTQLRAMPDNSVDSIVTDPPYGLSFMGKKWDYDVPSVEIWAECLRVLKPGGHLLAFAGTRTQHRMAVRIEDAGFEIRDMIAWVYGSGFPKSLDVSKAIDKLDGSATQRENQLRFTEWMRSTGLTLALINEITGTTMGSHYTTAASQPAVATRAHFEMMRPHLGCDVPDWVEALVDNRSAESENFKRREVVATKVMTDTRAASPACAYSAQGVESAPTREVAITTAHTEAARRWEGWGTALKPALEPITVARKPLIGTVAANVLAHGTGALNIDGCRVGATDKTPAPVGQYGGSNIGPTGHTGVRDGSADGLGRWPANLIHDGSEEVLATFPNAGGAQAPVRGTEPSSKTDNTFGDFGARAPSDQRDGGGSAARFFYCAKASKKDRDAGLEQHPLQQAGALSGRADGSLGATVQGRNNHPTVKPTDLMRYLCRLVTPPGGTVLDPFTGSGSTGKAAVLEGFRFIGFELDIHYADIAATRILNAQREAAE